MDIRDFVGEYGGRAKGGSLASKKIAVAARYEAWWGENRNGRLRSSMTV